MSPQMGVYTLEDDIARMAAHVADLDAHNRVIHELIRTGPYALSELMTTYRCTSEDTLVADKLYATAYPMSRDRTPAEIFVDIQTASVGDFLRIGYYADDGNCYPGALIADVGVVDVGAAGLKAIAYTTQLIRGLYWIAIISDGVPKVQGTRDHLGILGDTVRGYEAAAAWMIADTYGALPDPFPAGAAINTKLQGVGFKWASND